MTCSEACAEAYRLSRWLTCHECGVRFAARRRAQTFCSQKCKGVASRSDTPRRSREGWKYRKWRDAVLDRHGRRCVMCLTTDNLEAHHVLSWAGFPALRYEVTNGLTMCQRCHSTRHLLGRQAQAAHPL